MPRPLLTVLTAALLLALGHFAIAPAPTGAAEPTCCLAQKGTTRLATEIIASGLDHPWALAFLPDGSLLVTERPGSLRRIVDGKILPPMSGLPAIAARGQGGLLDIALDPDFDRNGFVYLSFAEPSANKRTVGTAVARGKLDIAGNRITSTEVIFTMNKKSSGGRHFGSRLRFASDKTLFVTLGDRGNQPRAQDPHDHAGSVVRINRDGTVPKDNPFADGKTALAEIWSTGHRNPQGAAVDPRTGQLWTLSHGARGGDEINKPLAGLNYGWPVVSYGRNYSGIGFEKGERAKGYEQPRYYWDPSIAPSGFAFYMPDNPKIPSWQGSLLAGALKARHLSRLVLEGDKIVAEERYLEGKFGRIRDVRTGPDGAVWLLTDSSDGLLIRVTEKN